MGTSKIPRRITKAWVKTKNSICTNGAHIALCLLVHTANELQRLSECTKKSCLPFRCKKSHFKQCTNNTAISHLSWTNTVYQNHTSVTGRVRAGSVSSAAIIIISNCIFSKQFMVHASKSREIDKYSKTAMLYLNTISFNSKSAKMNYIERHNYNSSDDNLIFTFKWTCRSVIHLNK